MSAGDHLVPVRWKPREVPLDPVGVAAWGQASRRLGRRLLKPRCPLESWRLIGASGLLVLLGRGSELPWVDGVAYLGRDPIAPSLLLPTTHEPDQPIALVERALLRRIARPNPPVAVLPQPGLLVCTGSARPVDRADLEAWLAREA